MLGEVIGELFSGVFRFVFRIFAEIIIEILVKGSRLFICRLFDKKVDPNGHMVVAVGVSFLFRLFRDYF